MVQYLLAFLFFLGFFALMGVGYLIARKTLKGSCGGLGALMGACDICEKREQCRKRAQEHEHHAA